MSSELIEHPLIDVEAVLDEADALPLHFDVSSYSLSRGFRKNRISRGETGFEAALMLLRDEADLDTLRLSKAERLALCDAGLIVDPGELSQGMVSDSFGREHEGYRRDGFEIIPEIVTPGTLLALNRHYRGLIERGELQPSGNGDRYVGYNDPAARVLQRQLWKKTEDVVGTRIKASYAYALLYRAGAVLPPHTDRPPNKYTISLLIDHVPDPSDGVSPWPFHLYRRLEEPPVEFFEKVGGGVIFRAGEMLHGRPPLPDGDSCWTMLFGFVDDDYEGDLD